MEKHIQIKSGDKEILDSGTFLTFDDKEVIISITYKDEEVKLYLKFVNTEDKKGEMHLDFEDISSQEMRIIFHNYNNTLGQFNKEPIELGTIAERVFYFSYYVVHLHDSNRKQFNYTFFLGKEVKNG